MGALSLQNGGNIMKYNMSFIIDDPMMEVKVEAGLRSDGYKVQRHGRKLTVVGIDAEWRGIIERYANRLWAF